MSEADNHDTKPLPVARVRRRRGLALAIAFAGLFALAMVAGWAMRSFGAPCLGCAPRDPGLALAVWLASWTLIIGFTAVWSLRYWRAIDEMARLAHLDAWYWGGLAAVTVITMAASAALAGITGPVQALEDMVQGETEAAAIGALGALLVLGLGYSLVWLGWWMWRR